MTTTKIQALKELNIYLPNQTHNKQISDLASFDNWLSEHKHISLREWLSKLEQDGLLNLVTNIASLTLFAG